MPTAPSLTGEEPNSAEPNAKRRPPASSLTLVRVMTIVLLPPLLAQLLNNDALNVCMILTAVAALLLALRANSLVLSVFMTTTVLEKMTRVVLTRLVDLLRQPSVSSELVFLWLLPLSFDCRGISI